MQTQANEFSAMVTTEVARNCARTRIAEMRHSSVEREAP